MNDEQLAESARVAAILVSAGFDVDSTRNVFGYGVNPWMRDGEWCIKWNAQTMGAWDDDGDPLRTIAGAFGVDVVRLEFDGGDCDDELCQCGIGTVYRVVTP